MRDFKKYEVWNNAISIAKDVYNLFDKTNFNKDYALRNQMQRSAVSISSNIAEGCSRSTDKDFARFIQIAIGSLFELESQMILSKELKFLSDKDLEPINVKLQLTKRQLISLYIKLRESFNK